MMCRALQRRRERAVPALAFLVGLWLLGPGPLPAATRAQAVPAPAASAAPPGTLSIEHEAPACVAAGKYCRLAACFRPQSALARARVYFRAAGTADWFYVEMSAAAPCHQAVLPRPKKGLQRLEYYIAATDRSFAETRTPEAVVEVTADGRCSAGPLAPVVDSANVIIGSASGAAPAGFVTGGGLSPLLIAGGVANGRGLAAALAMGAAGAVMGTRFKATVEFGQSGEPIEAEKRQIVASDGSDTVYDEINDHAISMSWPNGVTGRAMRSRFTDEWLGRREELKAAVAAAGPPYGFIRQLAANGTTINWAGESAGLVDEILPAAEVVARTVRDAEELLARLAGLLSPPTLPG